MHRSKRKNNESFVNVHEEYSKYALLVAEPILKGPFFDSYWDDRRD